MPQDYLFPDSPQEGTIVGGKYRLIRMISEGGGGVVWEARDANERPAALKFLKWSPLKSQKVATERFKNEFAILKSLSHPHISEIYDFGLDAPTGLYFFTTELLTAGDLKSMIAAPIPVIEELLLQSLRALEYLRGSKLLHLDIKPQNLLLRHDGTHPLLVLIDFGLATFRPPDRPGGTANYMPPELIVRRLELKDELSRYPAPDHRSDLYSLGATFYYIITGVQPFVAFTADGRRIDSLATMKRHLDHDPPPPSDLRPEVPGYLDRIVMKLLARHPDDRYPSAIVASQALQYSSPRRHDPESAQTLLAYLPKEGKMVGRRRERAMLEDCLNDFQRAAPHSAPIVCIAGGRGTGRTRLIRAVKPFAQQLEMEVISADDGAGGLIDALHASAEQPKSTSPRAYVIIIDDFDRYLAGGRDDAALSVQSDDSRDEEVMEEIGALIRKLRIQQRLKSAPGPRFFLVVALNSDRCDLKRAQIELNLDESICHTIELKNFTNHELAEYLTVLLGEAPDPAVVDELKRCTDGNPLFITEHLEEMIAKGRLFSLAGRPDAKTLKTIGVDFSHTPPPRSLASTISHRLSLLTKDARDLALLLACWPRPASATELRETSGRKSTSRDILMLVSSGLVRRDDSDGGFAFINSLAARIIRESAGPEEFAKWHDAIGAYLAAQNIKGAELDIHIAYGSGKPSQRIDALTRIADAAFERHEFLEAAQHIDLLLKLLPADDARSRSDALARQGQAYERARRYDDAAAAYRKLKGIKAAKPLKLEFRIRSAELLGIMEMRRRNLSQARKFFSEASDLIKGEQTMQAWRLKLENYLAGVDMRDGRTDEAVERYERTAAVAAKISDADERRSITNNELGEATLRQGQVKRALEILRAELKEAAESGDEERMANRHFLLGNACRKDEIHDYKEALEHYQEALKLSRAHHMLALMVRIHNGLGNLSMRMGDAEKAIGHYMEGLKLAQQVEGEVSGVELMIGVGLAAQKLSKYDDTIEYFEAALDFTSGPKGVDAGIIRAYRPTICTLLGDAYYQKSDLPRAESYLKEALAADKKKPLPPDIRYSLYGTCVEVLLARGDIEAAKRHMPTLKAIVKLFPLAGGHYTELEKKIGCHS